MGKGAAVAAPLLAGHPTMAPCGSGGPGFFHKHFQLWSFLLSFLQAVSLQPAAVPSLGLLSKPYIPAPNPPSAPANTRLRLRPEGSGTYHLSRSYAVLPAVDGLPPSPLSPQSSSSVPVDLPSCGNLSFPSAPLQRYKTLSHLLVSICLPFVLPGCVGIFLVVSGAQGPLLVFSKCSENCSVSRCILFLLIKFWLCWVLLLHDL